MDRERTIAPQGYEKAAYLYDLFDRKNNIDFFLQYGLEAGEILDIGAGTGRIAIPMAQRGIKVYGVEPSPAMRREFQRKLARQAAAANNIALLAGNATSFKFERTFPAAFLSGSFDHLLDDNERLSALANIRRHLEPNGKLVFDLFLGGMKDAPLSEAGWANLDNREYLRFIGSKILPDAKLELIVVFEEYVDGVMISRIEERSWVGIIDRQRVQCLLKQSGFELEREFGNYDFSPYRQGDSLLIVEASKSSR